MSASATDVFVSYKAEDRTRLKPLIDALEADGFSVWWDAHIGAGANWRRDIDEHLNTARCVLVAWTKRSVGPEGEFVRDEAGQARKRGTYLPVRFDAVDLPLGFREVQAISLKGWHGDRTDNRYIALVDAVKECITGDETKRPPPRPHEEGISRRTIIGGSIGAGAVAATGLGGWFLLRPAPASAKTIGVLPFANLSGDPAQAYFADGVAEEIRNALARLGDLIVVGRTSSEAVRNDDARTAARKLGVACILSGSVRQSPSTIRVSAELIDGRTGADRWSQNYDRAPGDTIKIQTDIAQNVASALSAALGGAIRKAIEIGGTQDASALNLYLQSDPSHLDESAAGLTHAVDVLNEAIRIDPNYALAYARKAWTLAWFAAAYANDPAQMGQMLDESASAADRAVALAPNLPDAHSALAFVYRQQLKLKDSLRESRIAVNLPGASPSTTGSYAIILAQSANEAAALGIANRAAAVDPLSPAVFEIEGLVLFLSRQFDRAAAAAQHALELGPLRAYARSILAYALIMLRHYEDAKAVLLKLPPDDVHALMCKSVIAWIAGDTKTSDEFLGKLKAVQGGEANYQYAQAYAQRGERDSAVGALTRAFVMRDPGLATVKVDPFLDPIRGDPRLTDIIRRLDFPS